jgi:hypothetical protein
MNPNILVQRKPKVAGYKILLFDEENDQAGSCSLSMTE